MSLLSVREGAVLRLTLDRPAVRNALNPDLIHALNSQLSAITPDSGIRLIILTGSGDRAFCAGADLDPRQDTFGPSPANPRTAYADLLRTAYHLSVPMLARVNGHCMAGGMGLLACCDMAVSVSTARFGLPETKVGLFPMQVAALLQRILPPRTFSQMCITGEAISATEALAYGLVNQVVDPAELDSKVDEFAARIVDKSPTAIRLGKHALRSIASMSVDEALAHMESRISVLSLTEDAREGLAAFRERRVPVWTGL